MKSGFYKTISDDQLSSWAKKFQSTSESQTCTTHTHTHTQRSWSLVVCWQSDPLQLSESQWNHYIWEVCSANHWDTLETATPAVGVGQQKGANSSPWQRLATHHTTTLQKFNELGHEVVPHLPCSPDLLSTEHHFFKHLDNFLQRKCFHNQQEAGKTSQDFIKSQSTALHYRKKQSNFSLAKMCWL